MELKSSLDFIGPKQAIVYALVKESDPRDVISYKYVGKVPALPKEEGRCIGGFPVKNGKVGIMSGLSVSSPNMYESTLKVIGYELAHPYEKFFMENGMDGPFEPIIGGTPGKFFNHLKKNRGERFLYQPEFDLVNEGMSMGKNEIAPLLEATHFGMKK